MPFSLPLLRSLTAQEARSDRGRMAGAIQASAVFVGLLFLIHLVLFITTINPGNFGVIPRTWSHVWGIFTAPLVHGSWGHLASNAAPLFFLTAAGAYAYPRAIKGALPFIWLMSGILVWLSARGSSHLGASGLVYGLMAWVVGQSFFRRDRASIVLALGALFLYGGGMLWGVLPVDSAVSFETHLAGALAGLSFAWLGHSMDAKAAVRDVAQEEALEAEEAARNEALYQSIVARHRVGF